MSEQREMVHVTEISPGAKRVVIDNPPLNLLGPDVFAGLNTALHRAEADDDTKVLVFESENPDYFIAHLDDRFLFEASEREGGATLAEGWPDFVRRLAQSPVVSVAVIRGRARGIGAEFVEACDIRYASVERAILAQGEVGFGAVPGGGGLEWLPQLVGRSRALEVVLGAGDVDATTAAAIGWVNRAVPDAELDATVREFVDRVASFDRPAIAAAKRLVNRSSRIPTVAELQESFATIIELAQRPRAQARMKDMVDRGFGAPSDVELNFPALLGGLAAKLDAAPATPGESTAGPRP